MKGQMTVKEIVDELMNMTFEDGSTIPWTYSEKDLADVIVGALPMNFNLGENYGKYEGVFIFGKVDKEEE